MVFKQWIYVLWSSALILCLCIDAVPLKSQQNGEAFNDNRINFEASDSEHSRVRREAAPAKLDDKRQRSLSDLTDLNVDDKDAADDDDKDKRNAEIDADDADDDGDNSMSFYKRALGYDDADDDADDDLAASKREANQYNDDGSDYANKASRRRRSVPADALTCYSCSSITDANCGDPFSAANVTTSNTCTACSKGKIGNVVTRACGTGSEGCIEASVFGVDTYSCICTSDNCNAAHHVTVTMGTILLGTAVVLLKNIL